MKKRKRESSSTAQKRRKTLKKGTSVKGGDVPNSRLLTLPAELREYIYKLVLSENQDIDITATLKQPSLLSVNRQVRREARDIWYNSNKFVLKIVACDDKLLSAFVKHCNGIKLKPQIELDTDLTTKSWTNLYKWCRNLWNKVSVGYADDDWEGQNVYVVAAAAHDIVFQFRDHLRWEACEVALENLHKAVEMFDPAWK